MAWDLIKKQFPNGKYFKEIDGFVTGEFLEQNFPDVEVVTLDDIHTARNMVIKEESYIYGKNNEYAVGVNYDVYNDTPHVDIFERPLNVYGMAMVNGYIKTHGIILGE